MDAVLQQQLSIAAVVMSAAALCFSLVAAFPGLKGVLSAVRDGVLWFALFLVAGGVGLVVWQQLPGRSGPSAAAHLHASGAELERVLAFPPPAQSASDVHAPDPRSAVNP